MPRTRQVATVAVAFALIGCSDDTSSTATSSTNTTNSSSSGGVFVCPGDAASYLKIERDGQVLTETTELGTQGVRGENAPGTGEMTRFTASGPIAEAFASFDSILAGAGTHTAVTLRVAHDGKAWSANLRPVQVVSVDWKLMDPVDFANSFLVRFSADLMPLQSEESEVNTFDVVICHNP